MVIITVLTYLSLDGNGRDKKVFPGQLALTSENHADSVQNDTRTL